MTGAEGYFAVTRYAGMSAAEAERNMRLFASDVMPRIRTLSPRPGVLTREGLSPELFIRVGNSRLPDPSGTRG